MRKRITVVRQLAEVGSRFEGFTLPKTNAGRRSIDLPPFLRTIIKDQLDTRGQSGPDGLVFVNTRGNSPHLSSFSGQTWKKARAAIGRPDLHWHDLRHTYAAMTIADGAHPKALQANMGHSSITVTLNVYGHLFPSVGVAIADGLEARYRASLAAPKTPEARIA